MIDSDQKLVLVQAKILGQKLPGKGDGLVLEIIAEREIPQHFEEGMVARSIADIVEIVMLAPGAHAFLGGGGAFVVAGFDAGEQVFELHHARIGEHQGRIVTRHQGAAVHDAVAVALEEIKIGGADVVQRGHARKNPLVKAISPGLAATPAPVHT